MHFASCGVPGSPLAAEAQGHHVLGDTNHKAAISKLQASYKQGQVLVPVLSVNPEGLRSRR